MCVLKGGGVRNNNSVQQYIIVFKVIKAHYYANLIITRFIIELW